MEKKNILLTENQLLIENEELRQRVYEYEETLNSIRNGEIDAIVVSGDDGEKIYSLSSVETKYRIIIEEMNEGAITTSKDGLITYCNARFAELISEPMERLVGSYFVNYLQESEQQIFIDLLQSGLKSKIVGQITYRFKSGHSLELQLSISPMPADIQNGICILFSDITQLKQQEKELILINDSLDQKIFEKTNELASANKELEAFNIASMSIMEDAIESRNMLKALHISSMNMMEDAVEAKNALEITNANLDKEIIERKLALDTLKKSESEFRNLAESMPQIVWATRADGWNIYFNQQWTDYTGLSFEESFGHGWNKPFHPDDQQRAWDAWNNAVKGNGIYSIETRLRRFDGEYRWWLVRGVPQINEKGEITGWYGTCTDIEEIKQTEKTLTESEEKFSVAFRNSPYAITITDPEDGKFIEVNDAFYSITGFTPEETLNNASTGMDLWVDAEDRKSVVMVLKGGGKVTGQEFQFKKKTGKIITGLFSAHLIGIKNKTYILSSISDITARKQAEEDINRKVQELNRFNNTMVDREIKMIELKEEINSYCKKLNLVEKYSIPEGFIQK